MEPGKSSPEPVAKKARGRPRRSAEGSDANEAVKRARGREIQRAFQYRRQAEVRQLQQSVAVLEGTVEGMSNEFLNFIERLVSNVNTVEVLDDVRRTTESFLELAKRAADPADKSSSMAIAAVTNTTWPDITAPVPAPFEFNKLFSTAIPNLNIPTATGRFSPRFGYGILDVDPKCFATPWDNPWLSYLIAGPYSFASGLYIDTIELVVRSLRGEVAVPEFIPSILRYRFRHESPDSLISTLATQLQTMSLYGHAGAGTGYIDIETSPSGALTPNTRRAIFASGRIIQVHEKGDAAKQYQSDDPLWIYNPTAYTNLNEELNNLLVDIIRDISLEGGRPGEWLDPWSVQEHIVQKWGLRLNSKTIQPTAKTLSVLQGYAVAHGEQETNVSLHSVPPSLSYHQNPEWPLPGYGNLFNTSIPTMAPNYPVPAFTFYSDPLVAQRRSFSKTTAPRAPPSHFLTTVAPFPPPAQFNADQYPPSMLQPNRPYMTDTTYYRDSTYHSGPVVSSGSLTSTHKTPQPSSSSATSRLSPVSNQASLQNLTGEINLPEVLSAIPLVTSLALRSICFGEGPRFQKLVVDETVRNYLEEHSFKPGLEIDLRVPVSPSV